MSKALPKTCDLGKTKVVSGTSSTRCESHYRTILYDGPNILAEYDSNGNLLKSYIHAPGIDNPLAEIDHTGAEPEWHYYLKDGQGSVAAITESDALAAVVAKYDYTAFGSLIPETSSPAPEADGQPTANFMYTGREYNPESGDYYFRWRTYSPTSGRFTGADPSGYTDGWNLYGSYFAGNGTDPMGLAWLEAKDAITYPFFKGTLYEEPGEELRYLTLNVGEGSIPWIESGTIWKKHIWVPTEIEARLALEDPTMYKLYLLWGNTNIRRDTGETILFQGGSPFTGLESELVAIHGAALAEARLSVKQTNQNAATASLLLASEAIGLIAAPTALATIPTPTYAAVWATNTPWVTTSFAVAKKTLSLAIMYKLMTGDEELASYIMTLDPTAGAYIAADVQDTLSLGYSSIASMVASSSTTPQTAPRFANWQAFRGVFSPQHGVTRPYARELWHIYQASPETFFGRTGARSILLSEGLVTPTLGERAFGAYAWTLGEETVQFSSELLGGYYGPISPTAGPMLYQTPAGKLGSATGQVGGVLAH